MVSDPLLVVGVISRSILSSAVTTTSKFNCTTTSLDPGVEVASALRLEMFVTAAWLAKGMPKKKRQREILFF